MYGGEQYDKVQFCPRQFRQGPRLLDALQVASQSTILVFEGGKEVARFAGVTDAARIKMRIGGAI